MDNNLVTVLMPVYNAELFLRRAIDSILAQTHKNIEFLIINDGSTDNSKFIINSYNDKRIVLLENDKNEGLIFSLNKGIKMAKGKYIARMDADDISFEKRIEKQFLFLEKNNSIGILGTCIQKEKKFKIYSNPKLNSNELKARCIFNNIFNHPTVMFRKSFLNENNVSYDQNFKHAEDYNLWLTSIKQTEFGILNEPLLFYENHNNQISFIYDNEQRNNITKAHQHFFNSLNLNISESDIEIHKKIYYQDYSYNLNFLKASEKWLLKILEEKNIISLIGKDALHKTVSVIWFEICTNFLSKGINIENIYNQSPLKNNSYISNYFKLLFKIKGLRNYLKF